MKENKRQKFIKILFNDQRIRFLFVGGINTVIGFGTYSLLIFFKCNPYVSTTVSTIIGTINSFFWNKYFTFKSYHKSLGEIIRFISVYGLSFILNIVFVFIFIDLLELDKYITGFICFVIIAIISFLGHKFFSFNERYKIKD